MLIQRIALAVVAGLTSLVSSPTCPGLVRKPEPRHEPWNIKFAEQLAKEVEHADAGRGFELVFYGDSITEQWRGTDQGGVCLRCAGDTITYQKYFGQYRSDVLAVGGDQIGNLFWRMENGELPRIHQPKVVVTMIGINDLGALAYCSNGNDSYITEGAAGVIHRLNTTIELLRDRLPKARLLFLGLLPRGDGKTPGTIYEWPGRYTPAIQQVNLWLKNIAEKLPRLAYLDCGDRLLQHGKISPAIQGDGLHPSPEGMEIMGKCIAPVVNRMMKD